MQIDKRVANVIDWLTNHSFAHANFTNFNDLDRLIRMANALCDRNIPIDEKSIFEYCQSIHLPTAAAQTIVNKMLKAQNHHLRPNVKAFYEAYSDEFCDMIIYR